MRRLSMKLVNNLSDDLLQFELGPLDKLTASVWQFLFGG